jgi:hypothetical protein
MTLSLFDQSLFEKVTNERFPGKESFAKTEILIILNEMTKAEKYYPRGKITKGEKYKVFKYFVRYCLYRNLANFDTMILLSGDKGCITGDALLEMPRDLVKYPKGIPLKKLAGKGPLKVYSFNKEKQLLELKDCDGVEFVKNDDVWRIELTNGKTITATKDHPFLLMNGKYKQLKDLFWTNHKYGGRIENGRVFKDGKYHYTDRLRLFTRPNKINNDNFLKIDYSSITKTSSTYNKLMSEHRFIMQQLGGDINNKYVHHIDGNHFNNNPDNLKILTCSEHHYEHNMEKYHFGEDNKYCEATGYSTKKKSKLVNGSELFKEAMSIKRTNYCKSNFEVLSSLAKNRENNNVNANHIKFGGIIKSIKYIGKRDVYDVVNVRDNHNFIVNGCVVSNTGKSSFAIMLAREWCRLLGISFSSKHHMAYSNSQVMERVGNLNRFSPLICLGGTSKIIIKDNKGIYYESINKLVGRTDFEVKTYNKETNSFEFIKPEKCVMTSKRAKVYKIELENGIKINATENHQFLTQRGYVQLKDLTEEDEIVINSTKCLVCNKEFVPKNPSTKCCSKKCINKYREQIDPVQSTKYKLYQEKSRNKNREKNKIQRKKYREENKEKVREQKKRDRLKHSENYKKIQKEYWIKNKESLSLKNKEWRKNNKTRIREYHNALHKVLMATNPEYKIKRNLRRRVNLALKNQGMFKDKSLTKYIGCTISELITYLETKFLEGMTYNNYGEWHVDHIIPCASFDLTLEENQKKCFHYTNLQPLWGKDNLVKGAKC